MGNVIQTPFDAHEMDGKQRHVYNTLRSALAERNTAKEEMEIINVGPIKMAIKQKLDDDTKTVATVILDHPLLLDGIQTKNLLEENEKEGFKWEPFYHPMLAVIATAIGIKEGFLRYCTLTDRIFPQLEDETTKEYLETLHGKSL